MLNIGTSGRTTVLFPNAIQRESRVRAGQTLTLGGPGAGYSIVPQGPAGVELVQVIATTRPLTLAELNRLARSRARRPSCRWGGRGGSPRDLAVQLDGAQATAAGPNAWPA